jgi:hypothetical protein
MMCQYARFYVTPPKQALVVSGMFWNLLEVIKSRLWRDLTNGSNPAQAVQDIT